MRSVSIFFPQVFVYSKQNYQHIKERLKTRGVAALSRLDLYNYFAPWYAEHLGQVRAASGNSTVEAWAHRKLRLSYYIFTYVSLLKLHGNGHLLRQLDSLLGNEAILSLDLKALTTLFKEPKKREWFQEIIDNYLKLWEINMWWVIATILIHQSTIDEKLIHRVFHNHFSQFTILLRLCRRWHYFHWPIWGHKWIHNTCLWNTLCKINGVRIACHERRRKNSIES